MPTAADRTAAASLSRLGAEVVDHRFKGLPPDAAGLTVGELSAQRRDLFTGGFTTPVLALSAEDVEHNIRQLELFSARHGLAFAPHGKTSMAPQLFDQQLAHGAWGITVAVPHQARVCRAYGVQRIFLANELVDAAALRWAAAELAADPDFHLVTYVDSVRGVELMDAALREAGAGRPLDVVIELAAGEDARTGVRTAEGCAEIARALADTATLRLIGVAGYEGEVPDADGERVRAWLHGLVELAADLDRASAFGADVEEIMLSAGGSAWFDAVAEVFAELPEFSRPVLKLLRSGAYVSHDDRHYRELTPFNRVPEEGELRAAFTLWTQVVSRPNERQAFLNAGKRDAAHDLHLPVARIVRSARDGAMRLAEGIEVVKLSDQHAWLETSAEAGDLEVGDWVGLGMSHPCTIFDKWQLIPLVAVDGTVPKYLRTFF